MQVFHDVAYKARNREDILAGVDEFLDKVTVLPPGEWDPNIRLEPPPEVCDRGSDSEAWYNMTLSPRILHKEVYDHKYILYVGTSVLHVTTANDFVVLYVLTV